VPKQLGRNIIRNAKIHVNKRYVLNIDIEDFFPSISFRKIKTVLELSPFKLNNEKENLAFIIANLVVYKDGLPQGAPTSPIISNMVCQRLDRNLAKYCNDKKYIKYSRYADDITFSSNLDFITKIEFLTEVEKIICFENLSLNRKKTRMRSIHERQEVTGLVVNKFPNINRNYIQVIRAKLYNWETRSLEFALGRAIKFGFQYSEKDKFKKSLAGQINFIGMVRGKRSPIFLKLIKKFSYLSYRINYDYIKNTQVRQKLKEDNMVMEENYFQHKYLGEDTFTNFCNSAFHQLENIVNYYYFDKYPDIQLLIEYVLNNNEVFSRKWKNINKLGHIKRVRDFDIGVLIYTFEKEHFFDKKVFIPKTSTFLRDVRNDQSHRSTVNDINKKLIKEEYQAILKKWKRYYIKNNRNPIKEKDEKRVELKFQTIQFLEQKDFKSVRYLLQQYLSKIK
jgi:RNA-directed DNA polymerase